MGRKKGSTLTKQERLEHSRLRAEEHHCRKRFRTRLFVAVLATYVLVPLLWYGAVEFGLIHPIRTPEFKDAVNSAGIVVLLLILYLYSDLRKFGDSADKKKEKTKTQMDNPTAA